MKVLLVLPVIVPLCTAAILIPFSGHDRVQRFVALVGAGALAVAAVLLLDATLGNPPMATQLGNWPAPFGITLVADPLAALMVGVTAFVGLMVAIFSLADTHPETRRYGFFPLIHILLMGVNGAFLTGDFFNLFVWFEVMLMASFALLCLEGTRAQIQGGVKYLVLNFLASSLFLLALGLLYGKVGSLNMADVAVKMRGEGADFVLPTAGLLFVAFSIKAGLFPLFSWLPASYHTPAASVSALFAGLLTKVGVYALLRVFTLAFPLDASFLQAALLWLSIATMVAGVLGAAAQFEMRRILSWHIISQIGYMTLAIALFTKAAFAACVFYVIHHIIVKTNLFLISGAVAHAKGTCNLKVIGGLYKDAPWLAVLFMIPAMSLGGIPPLSGFFAKFTVAAEGLRLGEGIAVGAALMVGLLTLFSMTKIWGEGFWKPDPNDSGLLRPIPAAMLAPIAAMALATLVFSFAPQTLLVAAADAAETLAEPERYISAVLGDAAAAAFVNPPAHAAVHPVP